MKILSLPLFLLLVINNSYSAESSTIKKIHNVTYTAFAGQFSEMAAQQEIKSSQNSPLSFSIGGRYKLNDYEIHANINYTIFNSAEVSGNSNTTQKVRIPAEIKMQTQLAYGIPQTLWSMSGGIDYEIFGTYNTLELTQGSNIETRKNNLAFASIGVRRIFSVFKKPFGTELTYSKSFLSNSSAGAAAEFEGAKIVLLLRLRLAPKYQVHFLFNRYDLEGATELTINRAGLGMSYLF